MSIEWLTEKRKIKDLIPFKSNPRKMSKEQARQLMDSLTHFDYVELVAINTDNTIIAGHMRIAAMKKLGWSAREIEVRVPNKLLTEQEMAEYCIRSNKNQGEWDWDELAANWDPGDLKEWGFTPEELVGGVLDLKEQDLEDEKQEKDTCPNCGQTIKDK